MKYRRYINLAAFVYCGFSWDTGIGIVLRRLAVWADGLDLFYFGILGKQYLSHACPEQFKFNNTSTLLLSLIVIANILFR